MDSFELISEWRLETTPERVWTVLAEPEAWPGWWKYVRRVELLTPGDEQGVGAVHRYLWSSRLPYRLSLTVRTVRVAKPRILEGEASGDVGGLGCWQLMSEDGGTRVRYTWRVRLNEPWMRCFAPVLSAVFAWNHHAVMREGARGMARHLGVAVIDYQVVT